MEYLFIIMDFHIECDYFYFNFTYPYIYLYDLWKVKVLTSGFSMKKITAIEYIYIRSIIEKQ